MSGLEIITAAELDGYVASCGIKDYIAEYERPRYERQEYILLWPAAVESILANFYWNTKAFPYHPPGRVCADYSRFLLVWLAQLGDGFGHATVARTLFLYHNDKGYLQDHGLNTWIKRDSDGIIKAEIFEPETMRVTPFMDYVQMKPDFLINYFRF